MNDICPPPVRKTADLQRRYGGATLFQRQEERRQRLIEAAVDVFGREGYSKATKRSICEQACVADRYFHESFRDLDALYGVVHMRIVSELIHVVSFKLLAHVNKPVECARVGLTAFFEYIRSDPRRARILLTDAVTARKTIPRTNNPGATWYVKWFKKHLAERHPSIAVNLEDDLIAIGLMGMIIQVASMWAQEKFEAPVDLVVGHCLYAWIGLYQWLDDIEQRSTEERQHG